MKVSVLRPFHEGLGLISEARFFCLGHRVKLPVSTTTNHVARCQFEMVAVDEGDLPGVSWSQQSGLSPDLATVSFWKLIN